MSGQVHGPVLIAGMHRGGTSAVAGMLAMLGFDLGPALMPPVRGVNDAGFWEHLDVFRINERLLSALGRSRFDPREMPSGWREHSACATARDEIQALVTRDFGRSPAWAIKDPRLCRVLPVWLDALTVMGLAPRVLVVSRPSAAVAASLEAQHWVTSRARGHLCWIQHMLEVAAASRASPRSMVLYDDLLSDWRRVRERVRSEIGGVWPDENDARDQSVDGFLSSEQRHFVPGGDDGRGALSQPALCTDVYAACVDVSRTGAWAALEALHAGYRLHADVAGPCLDEAVVDATLAIHEAGLGREALGALRENLVSAVGQAVEPLARQFEQLRIEVGGPALSDRVEAVERHSDEMRALMVRDFRDASGKQHAESHSALQAMQDDIERLRVINEEAVQLIETRAQAQGSDLAAIRAGVEQLCERDRRRFDWRHLFGRRFGRTPPY